MSNRGRVAIRVFEGPAQDVAVHREDPVAQCILRAAACRLAGDLDNAELWLNEAAGVYRALGVPNTSRLYREESRLTLYARLGQEPPGDDTQEGDFLWPF